MKTEAVTAKEEVIPPEIAQLIKGQSVCIDPERFFSKTFRAALPLIQHRLKESSPNTFTLEPKLFEDFLSDLRLVLEKAYPAFARFKPSDWISWVLVCRATGGEVDESPFDDYPDPEGYWEELSLRPNLTVLSGRPENTPGSASERRDSNTLALNVAFGTDLTSVEISITGEPLRTFFDLQAGGKMTPSEKRELQRRAKTIWNFLSDKISSRLGIQQLQRGRSLTNQSELSAFTHDHLGYSWAKVARELCKDERCKDEKGHWRHSHSCQERYRKLASLYWKRETARYAALARTRQAPPSPATS